MKTFLSLPERPVYGSKEVSWLTSMERLSSCLSRLPILR